MSPSIPVTASWTSEDRFEIRPCRWAGGQLALWQPHSPHVGKPLFAKPHSVRQRRAMAEWLCDVCGEFMPRGDRWSLSQEQPRAFDGGVFFLAVEPCVHFRCAQIATRVCPNLRNQITAGVARLRLIETADLVCQIITPRCASVTDAAHQIQPPMKQGVSP